MGFGLGDLLELAPPFELGLSSGSSPVLADMDISTFPTLDTVGSVRNWNEHKQDDTIRSTGDTFITSQMTFDPTSFIFDLLSITSADKVTLRDFYDDNKDKEFYWAHPRTDVVYIVSFYSAITFSSNNDIDSWNSTVDLAMTISLVA